MKQSIILLTVLILVVSFSSCRKDESQEGFQHVASSEEMIVPEGFTFNTTTEVSFTVHTNTIWGKEKIRVDIYDLPASAGGELLFSGFADGFGQVAGVIEMPAGLSRVFVELKTPDGNSEQMEVAIQGNSFTCQFSNPKSAKKVGAPSSPACNAGCVLALPAHSGNSVIKTSDQAGVYCFSGRISGSITANHPEAVVRICGQAKLESLVLNNGSSLEITDGASLQVADLQLNSALGSITVYNAVLEVNDNFEPYGSLTNYGKVLIGGSLFIKGLSSVSNYNELTVDDNLDLHYKMNNYHQLQVNQDMIIHGSGVLTNDCRISVIGDIDHMGSLEMHTGYLGNNGAILITQQAATGFSDASMMRTGNLTLHGKINGLGNPSLIKVNQQSVLSSSSQLAGSLQLCDYNGVEVMQGVLTGGAGFSCAPFIPRSACNPEGNGQSDYADSDNDGVKDLLDRYPSDPNKSGVIIYPSQDTYATLVFEDLWPLKGDYDFNDLVVRYRHTMITNADNMVTRIETELYVAAMGSGINKGFGFQFNLTPSDIESVSGQRFNKGLLSLAPNGTENGQSKAVIFAFDDVLDLIKDKPRGPFINTTLGVSHAISDTVLLVIELSSPKSIKQLGQVPFNPFIYLNEERGKEIHLIDQVPTDLVDIAYFGTAADATDLGHNRYYSTEDNHPWALNLVGDFAHPLEKTDILDCYIYFDIWAQSGGTRFKDWHIDHPGYRDANNVYNR